MADPQWVNLWRIAVSFGYPHPDLLLSQLTTEQAYELQLYHAQEPFGEVRNDMRFAHLIRFYYDSKRGKKGKDFTLGELMLYQDIAQASAEQKSTKELQAVLARIGTSG